MDSQPGSVESCQQAPCPDTHYQALPRPDVDGFYKPGIITYILLTQKYQNLSSNNMKNKNGSFKDPTMTTTSI